MDLIKVGFIIMSWQKHSTWREKWLIGSKSKGLFKKYDIKSQFLW
jgi:hypothetical protein